jgi:hypothetical protein
MLNLNRSPRASSQARGGTEELIPDPRGALTPAEIVEHKLIALLRRCGQGISNVQVCRQSSRDHGPASSLTNGAAAHVPHGADATDPQPDGSNSRQETPRILRR